MTQLNPQDIERKLTDRPVPPPPADLLERIQAEIPEPTEIPTESEKPVSGTRRWLIAATVVIAVGGGLLGYRTLQETDVDRLALESATSSEEPAREPVAAAPTAEPEPELETPAAQERRELADQLRLSAPAELEPDPPAEPRVPAAVGQETVTAPEPAAEPAAGGAAVTVRDRAGNALPGVTVEMSGAGGTRTGVTGASGQTRFQDLDPGSWELRATLDGFSTVEFPRVEVRRNRDTDLQVEMSAAVEETITVTSESPLLDQGPTSSGAVVAESPVQLRRLVESPKPRAKVVPMPAPRTDVVFGIPEGRPAGPSTGGTDEPNDQPYGDVFFREYGVNPFVDTEDDRFSTFGLDVDTGSYSIARRYLDDGNLPPREAIRVEEFLNYFDYRDAPPGRGDFALHADLAPAPFGSGERYQLLRFGIRGRVVADADRKPATLIFVVDVSGSMSREDRLGLVIRSLELLLDQLRSDDRVGLVTYGSSGQVLLEPTGDHEAIRRAVQRLHPAGSTNAEEGLTLAYELASRFYREGAINRIVLCSDGVANVGRTGPESILERVRRAAETGIELTTVGFGMGNYNDVLMEQLADRGNGSYAYVDDLAEARRIFVESLTGTLQTIAGDAKVQVEFNPEVVSRYRLLGYENRDIADERFRDDTVDAGEIGSGHSVTALYEVKLHKQHSKRAPLATLRLRYRSQDSGRVEEIERSIRAREAAPSWDRAPAALKLAAAVAELGEILKGSYWAKDGDLEQVLRVAQDAAAEYAGDSDVGELLGLIAKAAKLSGDN